MVDSIQAVLHLRTWQHSRPHAQVVFNTQVFENQAPFRDLSHAKSHQAMCRHTRNSLAQQLYLSCRDMAMVQVQQTRHRTNQRGFPCAIGTQQGNDATLGYTHTDILQGQTFSVVGHAQSLNI